MDSLTFTILSIIVFTFLSAFLKGRKKDRCLKKLNGDFVELYNSKLLTISGELEVESNSLIVQYEGEDNSVDKFILYKNEFNNMQLIMRPLNSLDNKKLKKRYRYLSNALKPSLISKFKRKLMNVFATAKDAVNDIISLLLNSAKSISPIKAFSAESKHVKLLKDDSMVHLSGNAYEPIWESNIGRKVTIEIHEDNELTISGILLEYSKSYIFLYNFEINGIPGISEGDILVNRSYGTIRYIR